MAGLLLAGTIAGYKTASTIWENFHNKYVLELVEAQEAQRAMSAELSLQLQQKTAENQVLVEELNEEARNDTTADNVSLPARSVSRLNKITTP